jgi:hypothetical protein
MIHAGPVDLTLVLSPDEMDALYAVAPYEHFTLAQTVQWLACSAAAFRILDQGRRDEASWLLDAAGRTRHFQWVEMSGANQP